MTEAEDLYALVRGRLERSTTTVLDGEVPPSMAACQYLVFYDDAPRLRPGALTSDFRRQGLRFRIVCAGRDAGEVRDATSWTLTRLAGWRPLPDDRTVGAIGTVPDGAPILPDRSVPGDVRFSQTLVFTVATTRS